MDKLVLKIYRTYKTCNFPLSKMNQGLYNLNFFHTVRYCSGMKSKMKVTVIGAAGKTGQSLCLMLKQSPLIDELCVHDIRPTQGFAAELSHVDTNCKVTAYSGKENLCSALENSRIVIVLAAAKNAELLSVDEMWEPNAPIVKEIVNEFAKYCSKAMLAIATNPVNSMVPLACEQLKKFGCFNPKTVFGITSLDVVRANTFAAKVQGYEPECVLIPVIGGHSEQTIVPVLSQSKPCYEYTNDDVENITHSVRNAHTNIIKMKPKENAPLSNAFAIARFIISLVKGLKGYLDVVECAYVPSCIYPQLKYLSTPIVLGTNGIAKNLGVPKLNDYENCLFKNAMNALIVDIQRGEAYAKVQEKICDPCDPDPAAPKCPEDSCQPRVC